MLLEIKDQGSKNKSKLNHAIVEINGLGKRIGDSKPVVENENFMSLTQFREKHALVLPLKEISDFEDFEGRLKENVNDIFIDLVSHFQKMP